MKESNLEKHEKKFIFTHVKVEKHERRIHEENICVEKHLVEISIKEFTQKINAMNHQLLQSFPLDIYEGK